MKYIYIYLYIWKYIYIMHRYSHLGILYPGFQYPASRYDTSNINA